MTSDVKSHWSYKGISLYMKQNPSADRQQPSMTN